MRAVVATADGPALVQRPSPPPVPGWTCLEVGMVGVCRTDIAAARGILPVAPGRVLGHEIAGWTPDGQLVSVHPRFADRRFLGLDVDGGFAERVLVPTAQLVPVPEDLDLRRVAFVEPMAAALSVLDVLPRPGRVALRGRGRIAELCRRVLAWAGQPLVDEEVDLDVLVTTGIEGARDLDAVRDGGTVVLKGRPAGLVSFDQRAVVERRLTLRGVDYGDFGLAARLLADGAVPVDDLFADAWPLDAFADVFEADEARKTFLDPRS